MKFVNVPENTLENEALVLPFRNPLTSYFSLVEHSSQKVADSWKGFGAQESADEETKFAFLVSIFMY